MGPLHTSQRRNGGYSLIEMLVVLAIISVLAVAGVATLGDQKGNSVRAILDELEGVLLNAEQTAAISSRDIYVSTTGSWLDSSLVMDGRALNTLTVGYPPLASQLKAGQDTYRLGGSSECFRSQYRSSRDHQSAGVDCGSNWYATACGSASDLAAVEPVASNASLKAALDTRLFTGSDSYAIVNGLTRRYEQGFSIVVVGLRSGSPIAGGAIGVIVVPANSASVYKFYKPSNSTVWRRL